MKQINQRILWITGIIVLVALILYGIRIYFWGGDYMFSYGHMSFGMMPFGMLGMVVFWIVLVMVINYYVQNKDHENNNQSITNLKNRLSKGEISIEEYEKLLNTIKEDHK